MKEDRTQQTVAAQDEAEIEKMVVAQATTDSTNSADTTKQQAEQDGELDERDSKNARVHP